MEPYRAGMEMDGFAVPPAATLEICRSKWPSAVCGIPPLSSRLSLGNTRSREQTRYTAADVYATRSCLRPYSGIRPSANRVASGKAPRGPLPTQHRRCSADASGDFWSRKAPRWEGWLRPTSLAKGKKGDNNYAQRCGRAHRRLRLKCQNQAAHSCCRR